MVMQTPCCGRRYCLLDLVTLVKSRLYPDGADCHGSSSVFTFLLFIF